jgi:hypothetical protein
MEKRPFLDPSHARKFEASHPVVKSLEAEDPDTAALNFELERAGHKVLSKAFKNVEKSAVRLSKTEKVTFVISLSHLKKTLVEWSGN